MPAIYRLLDVGTGAVVGDRIRAAHTHWTRLRGLLGTAPLTPREGLWLRPCRQVHTFGMRFPIDVAFCDRYGFVLHLTTLPPGRVACRREHVRARESRTRWPASSIDGCRGWLPVWGWSTPATPTI